MSVDDSSRQQLSNRLLSDEERTFCQNILKSGEGLQKQRAAALLALDDGSSRAEAGQETGLTRGQVRYLLETFREKRLGMFPQKDLTEIKAQPLIEESTWERERIAAVDVKVDKPSGKKKYQKKKKQKKEKKLKAKGKKMAKKGKKIKKDKGAKSKGKKGKAKDKKKGKRKGGKKK